MEKVAYGTAMFGQRHRNGLAGLAALLGVTGGQDRVPVHLGIACLIASCAPPNERAVYINVWQFDKADLWGGGAIAIHELAYVIDWVGGFSARWGAQNIPLTKYAEENKIYPQAWDIFAEAVMVWAYSNKDATTGVWSSGIGLLRNIKASDLTAQMDQMTRLLGAQ